MWTHIISAVIGGGLAEILRYGLDWYRDRHQQREQWYEDAANKISRGYIICEGAKDRSDLNYRDIASESDEMAKELNQLVNPYPAGIENESVKKVKGLSTIFRKLSAVAETSNEKATEEALDEIFNMGKQEYAKNEDLNMGEAVEESTNYSKLLNEYFSKADTEPKTFGAQFEDQIGELETLEELVQEMGPQVVNEGMASKAIESEVLTEDWEKSLSLGVRIFLQITSNMSTEALNHISDIKDLNTAD